MRIHDMEGTTVIYEIERRKDLGFGEKWYPYQPTAKDTGEPGTHSAIINQEQPLANEFSAAGFCWQAKGLGPRPNPKPEPE